jgi:ornithine cyclodeaminase/alanine dehydrogenase-like protein (mu-crystallin family)
VDDNQVIVLTRRDIAALMRPVDYFDAVEAGFLALAQSRADAPPALHLAARDGGLHAKAATLVSGARSFAALKLNGNFPRNPERSGLPTIQGLVLLCDAENGRPLAVMDSIEVTLRRTAAASAIAAKLLARSGSSHLAICGCGAQGRAHLEALADVFALSQVSVWDGDAAKAERFVRDTHMPAELALSAVHEHRAATLSADIIVTCTTSQTAFLRREDVGSGAFIAAVGADAPHKSEIDPALMTDAGVIVDDLDQCQAMGDLRHAIAAGAMSAAETRASLPQLISGQKQGRIDAGELIVFDSTGVAIEDVASAVKIYARARERGVGATFAMGAL